MRLSLATSDELVPSVSPKGGNPARTAPTTQLEIRIAGWHDNLFRMQPNWAAERSAIGSFLDYAETVGLDEDEFRTCLNSDRYADVVSANMQLAAALNVSLTPTVLVQRGREVRRMNSVDYQSIESAVNDLTTTDAATPGN